MCIVLKSVPSDPGLTSTTTESITNMPAPSFVSSGSGSGHDPPVQVSGYRKPVCSRAFDWVSTIFNG